MFDSGVVVHVLGEVPLNFLQIVRYVSINDQNLALTLLDPINHHIGLHLDVVDGRARLQQV